MDRILYIFFLSIFSYVLAVVGVPAQQAGESRQVRSQIKIEAFSWYPESAVEEPRAARDSYYRGLPEGISAYASKSGDASLQKADLRFVYKISALLLADKPGLRFAAEATAVSSHELGRVRHAVTANRNDEFTNHRRRRIYVAFLTDNIRISREFRRYLL